MTPGRGITGRVGPERLRPGRPRPARERVGVPAQRRRSRHGAGLRPGRRRRCPPYFDGWRDALGQTGSDQVDQALATVTGLPLDPDARPRTDAAPAAPRPTTPCASESCRTGSPRPRPATRSPRRAPSSTTPRHGGSRTPARTTSSTVGSIPTPACPTWSRARHEQAGLTVPAGDRPRLRLDAVDNRIAYDHRVLDLGDRNVQDFTVKVFLDARDDTAADARPDVETRVRDAVDAIYNRGFRIGADQLNVTVEFVTRPSEAHAVVALHGTPAPTTQTTWSTHSSDLDLAHEIGHFLGCATSTRWRTAPWTAPSSRATTR
ncbi:hypothetical protein V2I01_32380 [Micromonospora sp. BRA006-A]|nr:hypothetical protein [Micromonospora sp. BRA006-A]